MFETHKVASKSRPGASRPDAMPEALKQGADASKTAMAAFGGIKTVVMQAPKLKPHSLADLEWLAVPW